MNRGITDIPIHPDSSRIQHEEDVVALTGLKHTSTVATLGRIVSIRSYIVVNRSTAVMNRGGAVDISCRHRGSIVRHNY